MVIIVTDQDRPRVASLEGCEPFFVWEEMLVVFSLFGIGTKHTEDGIHDAEWQ
jgi:hypothetical protein